MKPSQQRIREVFAQAVGKAEAADRENYLAEACDNEPELRQQVESLLLAHDQAGEFLSKFPESQAPWREGQGVGAVRYFGDYELHEEICRGGMGVVYRARQVTLNRTVAVKMILAGEFAGDDMRQRFQREAEAAAQLRHPNIVTIHEVGEHDGRSYYSMDYIEGRSLAVELEKGKMPPAQAATLLKTLAEAVHFAHQRGTLHRDLKPHNILLGADDQAHILDFGLARSIQRDTSLTRTGDVMGSPSYMPPEQAMGRAGEIGPATDVYSLGAILFEALTGRPPFSAETPMEVLEQVINHEPPSPRKLNPGIPTDLETICLKCLEKRPERRYHSARALAEELERFLNFEPILARPASRWRKAWNWTQRNPWVFAAMFGVAALAMFCVAYGFWEQTQFLHWQLEAQKTPPTAGKEIDFSFRGLPGLQGTRTQRSHAPDLGTTRVFFFLFPVLGLLLHFVGRAFRRRHRPSEEPVGAASGRLLLGHAVCGIVGVLVGISYLLAQIRSWMWQTWMPIPTQVIGSVCAVTLIWAGLRNIWEALGVHETSRYRGLVDKAMEQEQAVVGRMPIFRLMCLGALISSPVIVRFTIQGYWFNVGDWSTILGIIVTIGITALATWAVVNRHDLSYFVFTFVSFLVALILPFLVIISLRSRQNNADQSLLGDWSWAAATVGVMLLFQKPRVPTVPRRSANPWLEACCGLAPFVALAALTYQVEDLRGAAAWSKCQSELKARGEKTDWAAFIPSQVPDEKNIFKAPKMQEWFVGQDTNELSALLVGSAPWWGFDPSVTWANGEMARHLAQEIVSNSRPITIATVTLAVPGRASSGAGTVLRYEDPAVAFQASQLLSNALGPVMVVHSLSAYLLGLRPVADIHRVRIVLETVRPLTAKEVAALFPENIDFSNGDNYSLRVKVERDTTHADPKSPADFTLTIDTLLSAKELADWAEEICPQLDIVRHGLQRPLARMDGDYSSPFRIPVLNSVTVRLLGQMLSASAQADLIFDDPQSAMEQLTLLHDLRRLSEGPAGGQPETLHDAMINVSLGGIHAITVGDGLRLHKWQEPQLTALEKQLKETDVLTGLKRGLELEQRSYLTALDDIRTFAAAEARQRWTGSHVSIAVPESALLESFSAFEWECSALFAPKGWWDQNKVSYVQFYPDLNQYINLTNRTIQPDILAKALSTFESRNEVFNPYAYMAVGGVPNYLMAASLTARNQTFIDQALIVCALERYRLAHHEYPPSLDALVPQYVDDIPHDVVGGEPPVYQRGANGDFQLSSAGWSGYYHKDRWAWPPQ